jgi:hypothetical protein
VGKAVGNDSGKMASGKMASPLHKQIARGLKEEQPAPQGGYPWKY